MSQDFNLNFDEMKHGPTDNGVGDGLQYPAHGNIRNIGFAWPNGERRFLNYAYLVSGDFLSQSNTITLEFTTHTVMIEGVRLEKLFEEIMAQVIKWIVCKEQRYAGLENETDYVVTNISILRTG